ncbi:hypothetical protein Echvi_0552 [Echinicola vietnamensis DSM 17526]|uniref:Uncharacterized protein n=1 Tax=Echinicola vietnamensis (strain DSM 17526 / LMG 23754 / KMM 6221) TaxID=926556 RepID=L0FVP3_ECHVK|nr:hypothetical protein Echvi_0552 [Echinicola vietnamensis DSM 17526]
MFPFYRIFVNFQFLKNQSTEIITWLFLKKSEDFGKLCLT